MKVRTWALAAAAGLLIGLPAQAATDWAAVGIALGKAGAVQAGGVYRVGLPRTDLKVVLDGIQVRPALALGSWLAFKDEGDHAMVMGDLVLTEEEVKPVMTVLAQNGVAVTALHNHLLRARPSTVYMHVDGHGDAMKLATALHAALARSGTPLVAPPATPPAPLDFDTARLDQLLGAKGVVNGGVYQFAFPRQAPPRVGGMEIPPAMGSAIGINFQPTGAGKAAVTGDFVLTADEVNPAIDALLRHGIEVTALHNHMLDDEPRLFFMHFWANADAQTLAGGLRDALDKVKLAPR